MDIFGLSITRKKKEDGTRNQSFVNPTSDDGTNIVQAGGYFGQYVDIEGAVKNEADLIRRYRDISTYPDCDLAIEDIVSETISAVDDEEPVSIILDDVQLSDSIKKKIVEEFDEIINLLGFNTKGHDIFRRWYIDGRLYYHKIVDINAPKKGIVELRYIDPRKIKKVREVKKENNEQGVSIIKDIQEYFVYSERGLTPGTNGNPNVGVGDFSTKGVKINTDAITYITSGLIDLDRNVVLSYLHKAIKPVNSLRMMEDALVIYRMSRAPERRIFYIDVGRLPTAKAEQYIKDLMVKYRNKVVYDAQTGEMRDDRKHMCLAMDTKVPLLDGRTLTIAEIAEEHNQGKQLWAYSCDPVTGKFVPGLITWAGETRKDAQVMRITLDNGKTIVCTPDHKFPVWNKGFVQAQELTIGESMIPHYTRQEVIRKDIPSKKLPYLQIFENDRQSWSFVHRLVSSWKDDVGILNEWTFSEEFSDTEKHTVHHRDFNKNNNSPENLVRMNNKDHGKFHTSAIPYEDMIARNSRAGKIGGKLSYEQKLGIHAASPEEMSIRGKKAGEIGGKVSAESGKSAQSLEYGRTILANLITQEDWNSWFRSQQISGWTDEKRNVASAHAQSTELSRRGNDAKKTYFADKNSEVSKKHTKLYKTEYTEEMYNLLATYAQQGLKTKEIVKNINKEANLIEWVTLNSEKVGNQKDWSKIIVGDIARMVKSLGFSSYTEYKNTMQYRNHKIANIEFLPDTIDTGCITIDGDERFHGYHTFALDAGIYTKNSMLEDFWLPRQEGGKGTEITTLPGGENLGQIDDIIYFQKKLYQALNVPLSRLNPDQAMAMFGRQAEVSRDELKFSKFIGRLRKKFSELFSDLLKTNLILKGIVTEQDWELISNQIRYDFNQDEYYAEVKEAEVLRNRIDLLNQIQPYVGIYYSQEYVQKKVLRLSDKEIEQMSKEIEKMAAEQQEQEIEQEEQAATQQPNAGQPAQQPQFPQQAKSNKGEIDV